MSFETSLDTLLSNLFWVILTPPWLISKSHSKIRRQELFWQSISFSKAPAKHMSLLSTGVST